jgi:ribosomal protein S12 methylthiotransferase accessory factor
MAPHADFLLGGRDREPGRPLRELRADHTPGPDLRDDVEAAVRAVTDQGFDVVVVDQTMPVQRELGLRTAAVIVPGLVPIDFGWSRQRALHMPRLATALRQAGRLPRDLTADELNQAPHPFP